MIEPVGNRHALAQRNDRARIGADIGQQPAAQREELPLRIQSQFHLRHQVAALVVAEERLAALAGPFHRPAQLPRGPDHEQEFREHRVLGAEIAANIVAQHANLVLRHAEHEGDFALLALHAPTAGMQRVAAGLLVIGADGRAHFHRHAGHALNPGLQPRHMRRLGKRRLGRVPVADMRLQRDIRRRLIPERGRIFPRGVARVGHGRQRLVFHLDQLGRVLGDGDGLGNDEGHTFAAEAHAPCRQHRVWAGVEELAAILVQQHRIGHGALECDRAEEREIGRYRVDAIRQQIGMGVHRHHARQSARGTRVDAHDAGMGVRRAQNIAAGLARQVEIVAVAAASGDQPQIFLAPRRRADANASATVQHERLRSINPAHRPIPGGHCLSALEKIDAPGR